MIRVYAVTENGDGYVMQIGEYEDLTDFELRVGMFSKDTLITFEHYTEPVEDEE